MFIAIGILLVSAVLVFERNNTISSLENENRRLLDDLDIKSEDLIELQTEVNTLTSSMESMLDSIGTLEETLSQIEAETELTSYARVVSMKSQKVYLFEETMNYIYNVDYHFEELTDVVLTVLDSDQRTVLGFMEVTLVGEGTENLLVEIETRQVSGKWTVYPSIYWLEEGTPTYSPEGWTMKGTVNVIDGSQGHTQSSCSEESAICHGG